MKNSVVLIILLLPFFISGQPKLDKLTVEKIMRDPKWIGSSPSNPYWSRDGKFLLFNWNPENASSDSLYYITTSDIKPQKTTFAFRESIIRNNSLQFNSDRTAYVYSDRGDIYYTEVKSGKVRRLTQTVDAEINPQFSFNDTKVVFSSSSDLFAWDIATGQITQLTNFQTGGSSVGTQSFSSRPPRLNTSNTQESFLRNNALENSEVLKSRRAKRNETDSMRKLFPEAKRLRTINIDERSVFGVASQLRWSFYNISIDKTSNRRQTDDRPNLRY